MFGLANGWLWAIGGLLLLIAEILAPGFFLIFIGAAAIGTGFLTLAFGLTPPFQLILFVVFAGTAVMLGRRRYEEPPNIALGSNINEPEKRLIGKTVTVVAAVDEQSGRVRLGDSEWSARGGPAESGERVEVVAVEGNCLIVRRNF